MADLKICFGSQSGLRGWVGFQESYVIFRVGHGKCLRPITSWMGGVKKGQKHAYVIFEWSLICGWKESVCFICHFFNRTEVRNMVDCGFLSQFTKYVLQRIRKDYKDRQKVSQ